MSASNQDRMDWNKAEKIRLAQIKERHAKADLTYIREDLDFLIELADKCLPAR